MIFSEKNMKSSFFDKVSNMSGFSYLRLTYTGQNKRSCVYQLGSNALLKERRTKKRMVNDSTNAIHTYDNKYFYIDFVYSF